MKLLMWPKRLVGIAAVIATLQLIPVSALGIKDVLETMEAVGFRPQLVELNMDKFGESSGSSVERRDVTDLESQFIASGQDAFPKEFTHQATLMISTSVGFYSICGAVLISAYHALTAAHCLPYLTGEKNVTMYNHFIGVGVLNLTQGLDNPGSQMAAVLDYRIHPDFDVDKPGFPNDIAMLYVDGPIVENSYVKYAKLAQPGMGNFAKTTCLISGWGLTHSGEPTILQWGYQYIPTQEDCENFWAISRSARITKRQICGYSHPIQICTGDSGGPLVCNDVVVGIVSWGLANCSGCFPGIYTRISVYYWWILRTMSVLSRRNQI